MKTFLAGCLKVLLVVACGIVLVHFWSLAMVPLVIGLVFVLGLGALLLAGVAAVGAVGVVVIVGLLAAVIALLTLLSPVWIPVLAVVGMIWLMKKLCGPKSRTVVA
jgi:hypothetical protein